MNKNKAIEYFRENVSDNALCETLVWLIIIYLQNDSENDLVSRPQTAEDYFCKLNALYSKNEKIPKYYQTYLELGNMIGFFMSHKGDKDISLRIYKELANEDYSDNLEIRLLLNEFKRIYDADKRKNESEQSIKRETYESNTKSTGDAKLEFKGEEMFASPQKFKPRKSKEHSMFNDNKSNRKKA